MIGGGRSTFSSTLGSAFGGVIRLTSNGAGGVVTGRVGW
jgi:hypothetical protein